MQIACPFFFRHAIQVKTHEHRQLNFRRVFFMRHKYLKSGFLVCLALILSTFFSGCSVAAPKTEAETITSNAAAAAPKGATIKIEPNSPADTVRSFYAKLREKKFREAIFLTNLRPAIEGLSDKELKEFQVDFEAVAKNVPAEIEINGEITSGDSATVTTKLPGDDPDKSEIQEVRLRRENGVWVILTVDETAEKQIKQQGKNYFYALRIETHHDEAKAMLDRISKAQIAYSTQNQGKFGEIPALIESGFLPSDVQTPESTGYLYAVTITDDKTRYSATATPAEYGKSGKLSFLVRLNDAKSPLLSAKDTGGKPLKK